MPPNLISQQILSSVPSRVHPESKPYHHPVIQASIHSCLDYQNFSWESFAFTLNLICSLHSNNSDAVIGKSGHVPPLIQSLYCWLPISLLKSKPCALVSNALQTLTPLSLWLHRFPFSTSHPSPNTIFSWNPETHQACSHLKHFAPAATSVRYISPQVSKHLYTPPFMLQSEASPDYPVYIVISTSQHSRRMFPMAFIVSWHTTYFTY